MAKISSRYSDDDSDFDTSNRNYSSKIKAFQNFLKQFLFIFAGVYSAAVPKMLEGKYMRLGLALLIFSALKGLAIGHAVSLLKGSFWLGSIAGFIVFVIFDLIAIAEPKRNPNAPPLYSDKTTQVKAKYLPLRSSNYFSNGKVVRFVRLAISFFMAVIAAHIFFMYLMQDVIIQEYKGEIDAFIAKNIQPQLERAEKERNHADFSLNYHAIEKIESWQKEHSKATAKKQEIPGLSKQWEILEKLKTSKGHGYLQIGELFVFAGFCIVEAYVLLNKMLMPYDAYDHKMHQLEFTEVHRINAESDAQRKEIDADIREKQNNKYLNSPDSNIVQFGDYIDDEEDKA